MPKERCRLGLALSGGGARGLAHIGVLKVLDREGIAIDAIAGTSMGGLIGALFAAGLSAGDIEQKAMDKMSRRGFLSLLDPAPLNRGLLQGQRVRAYMHELLGDHTFADLRLPLALTSVDLLSRQPVTLRSGSLVDAIRATISVPGVFPPLALDGRLLVDGGVLNNLPNDVIRSMNVDRVIAVDVLSGPDQTPYARPFYLHGLPSGVAETIDIFWQAFDLMLSEIQRLHLENDPPDVMICPPVSSEITMLGGFGRCAEIIRAGERAAEEALDEITCCLEQART